MKQKKRNAICYLQSAINDGSLAAIVRLATLKRDWGVRSVCVENPEPFVKAP